MPAESTDQFRRRVLGGETLFGLFLDLSSPASAELCGRAGYDWLLIDLEHGAGHGGRPPADADGRRVDRHRRDGPSPVR